MFVSRFTRSAALGTHALASDPTTRRHVRAQWLAGLAVAMISASILLAGAPKAEAAAYAASVNVPKMWGPHQAKASVNLVRDCRGTYGCWNKISIETPLLWGKNLSLSPREVDGGGVAYTNPAWLLKGCRSYRTTVVSTNDVVGSIGGAVNVGQVGIAGNGMRIYRFKTTKSSAWRQLCR